MPTPALCASLDYDQTWHKCLQKAGRPKPNKDQLPAVMKAWKVWGEQAGLWGLLQQELTHGPKDSVRIFDCATVGNATLTCTRVETSKFSRDSLVLTTSGEKYSAGHGVIFSHMHRLVGRTVACLRRQTLQWWTVLQKQCQLRALRKGQSTSLNCPGFHRKSKAID